MRVRRGLVEEGSGPAGGPGPVGPRRRRWPPWGKRRPGGSEGRQPPPFLEELGLARASAVPGRGPGVRAALPTRPPVLRRGRSSCASPPPPLPPNGALCYRYRRVPPFLRWSRPLSVEAVWEEAPPVSQTPVFLCCFWFCFLGFFFPFAYVFCRLTPCRKGVRSEDGSSGASSFVWPARKVSLFLSLAGERRISASARRP